MKKTVKYQGDQKNVKQKLMVAISMLLISTILLTTTSYAWFILSVAPEVTGITTNVGANGSLEIALLNTETRQNLSTIRSSAGNSLAQNRPTGNLSWGNLVDLSDEGYGLGAVTLMPARLDVAENGDGYAVNSGLLAIPTYGFDGRVIDVTANAMSAVYAGSGEFTLKLGEQDYGVRAVGTNNSMSVQASELASAKTNISTYANSTRNGVSSALQSKGNAVFNVMMSHATNANATYDDTDVANLKALINDLQTSVSYIDLALRNGIVAFAASQIGDEDTFVLARNTIMNREKEIDVILQELGMQDSMPESFGVLVAGSKEIQNSLNNASNACNALSGGTYTWAQIRVILDEIMNADGIYINEYRYSELTTEVAMGLLGKDIVMTLAPGSGVLVDIADYAGNYTAFVKVNILGEVEVVTASVMNPSYIESLYTIVSELKAAESGGADTAIALTNTYGYALDMAFRCNAANADLLLQTKPEQRIYEESVSASTMGGGSFMEFTSMDETLTTEQKLLLMDAIRVGFLDDMGNLLKVAKLNTSNRTFEDGAIKAPLYIYEYSFSEEDGSMIIGERQVAENMITTLEQNTPKALTALVWLDGDVVDNTMVSATNSTSLGGTLNLQFATSANLIPAANSELMNIATDKAGLKEAIEGQQDTLAGGKGTYTTVSWKAFTTAYNAAAAVSADAQATESQIYNAALNLAKASSGLETVSKNTISEKIWEIRAAMGTWPEEGYTPEEPEPNDPNLPWDDTYFTELPADDYLAGVVWKPVPEPTEETTSEEIIYHYEFSATDDPSTVGDNTEIIEEVRKVDPRGNYQDEGNDIYTQIYTWDSWNAQADAMYRATAVYLDPNATDEQIDAALTAMETAQEGLERVAYYTPYDLNGTIYYMVVSDETDTYGKWYDAEFKRVVSDRTILMLDANAKPAEIVKIDYPAYLRVGTPIGADPVLVLQDDVYTELAGQEILRVRWDNPLRESGAPNHNTILSISAEVETNRGVRYTAEINVNFYEPASGVEITGGDDENSLTLPVAEMKDLTAALMEGTETIKTTTWASNNSQVVSVSGMNSQTCTVTAVAAGTADITLSVTTYQGNTYTSSLTVTVEAP